MARRTNRRATARGNRHAIAIPPEAERIQREDHDTAEDQRGDDAGGRPPASVDGTTGYDIAVVVDDSYAGKEDALRDEPMKGGHCGEEGEGVAIGELEPVGAALGAYRVGYAQRFAMGRETEELGREKHAGEEAVVGQVNKGDQKLRRVGDEDVGGDSLASGGCYEEGGSHDAEALVPDGVAGDRVVKPAANQKDASSGEPDGEAAGTVAVSILVFALHQ